MSTFKSPDRRNQLAVFLDFENLAIGLRGQAEGFSISRIMARLVEKGNIVVKRAYADWKRYSRYVSGLHEAAFEMIEIPVRGMTGKNSADMRLCVDAMDLCYSKSHIDTFVIVSGDSDFSPLISKLKENGKYTIGLGMQDSTSELLRDNCDEFIYYEDLLQAKQTVVVSEQDDKKRQCFELLIESLQALRRENREILWSSMVKETMQRKRPSFNENYYGYRSFSRLLEDARSRGLLELSRDQADKTYIVSRFGEELVAGKKEEAAPIETKSQEEAGAEPTPSADPAVEKAPVRNRPRRSSRRTSTQRTRKTEEVPTIDGNQQSPAEETPKPDTPAKTEKEPAKQAAAPRRRRRTVAKK